MTDNSLVRSNIDGAVTGFKHSLLLATADELPGYRVEKIVGLVRGNTIRARHVGRDIMAGLRNIVGGELKDYTKLMAESREQAIDRMVEQATGLGANAITGIRLTTSTVMGCAIFPGLNSHCTNR